MVVKVGFVKLGSIGSANLIEFLLDERAERKDLDVRVVGSGAKIGLAQAEEAASKLLEFEPDLAVVTSPNASLPGPTKARELLAQSGVPTIVVSDGPTKKIATDLEAKGFGYLIVQADSMLGARREFLDPIEMVIFNADLMNVLAMTGAFNVLYEKLDEAIQSIKEGREPTLPRVVVDGKTAVEGAGFANPYAKAKALAAHEIAKGVSRVTAEACFKVKEWERYTAMCTQAHEMMSVAADLAKEARCIEKSSDTVLRKPHYDDGTILVKRKLLEKPREEGSPG